MLKRIKPLYIMYFSLVFLLSSRANKFLLSIILKKTASKKGVGLPPTRKLLIKW